MRVSTTQLASFTKSCSAQKLVFLRALPFFLALAFVPVAQAGPVTTASARASGSASGCQIGGTPTGSNTADASSSSSTATLFTGPCLATAAANARSGSLHINTHVEGTNTVVNRNGQQLQPASLARATADISETVDANFFNLPAELQNYNFYVPVSVRVSGDVSIGASTLGSSTFGGVFLPFAAISYSANVQGTTFGGYKEMSTSESDGSQSVVGVQSGQWGYLDFLILISALVNNTYNLSLTAASFASLDTNSTVLPEGATGSATGDFSHSLDWLGISGPIRAFDQSNQEAVLPTEFRIDMIGRDTGFNYSQSSIVETSSVPEPSSGLLFLASLVALGLTRWRSKGSRVSPGGPIPGTA